uniref:Circadian associated repressor of transcription n=1 Tax=Cyclopterus lumpus TaxID=8103 RepID=A0A8C2WPZ6_CYCLU
MRGIHKYSQRGRGLCVCVCGCVRESKGGWRASLRQRGGARESTGGRERERERERESLQPTSQIPKSQGDVLFAQKCAELQGFVRPMLELLNGLKRGRFDRGLSSFQQSVAMDRIQRIVGVLQRPNSGEKYLNTLLQVEIMLKLWFPQIHTQVVSAASSVAASPAPSLHDTSRSTPPHKHKDQLHIPPSLTWVHVAPILSPRKACPSNESTTVAGNNEKQPVTPLLPLRRRGSPETQDSSISSTTHYKHPKNLKKPIRCQSQPITGHPSESENSEMCRGPNQAPQAPPAPLPEVCPTPP